MHPIRALKSNPDRLVLAVALPLVLLVCIGLYMLLAPGNNRTALHSDNGVWDLRGYDLSTQSVQVNGSVQSIPDALLTPAEFAGREGEAVLLDAAFSESYGTSRLRLLLPDDGWVTIARHSIDYGTRLFVNGEMLAEVGFVADNAADAVADYSHLSFTVRPVNGVVELVVQSSNFVHRNGGYHGGWTVGGKALARSDKAAEFALTLELGAYFALFFFHLLLFLMLPAYKPNLVFALYCLTWFMRIGTTGGAPFSVLLPWLPWGIRFRLEYGCVSVAVLLGVLLIRELFPGVLPGWAQRLMLGGNAILTALCLALPTITMSYLTLVYLGVAAVSVVYTLLCFACKFRTRPGFDQALFLTGIGVFCCASVWDIALFVHYLRTPGFFYAEMTQIAMLAFSLLSATAFFTATMREVRAAKSAEQRLAAENEALEQVNRLKSDLMSTLSHELRTPLTVMSGYAQLSGKQIEDGSANADTRDNLLVVSREARRLAELAGGLLEASIGQGATHRREWLEVRQIFDRAAAVGRPILQKRGNRLTVEAPNRLPPVWANADMIHQVLLNLLTNANRYTQNGAITFAAEADGGGAHLPAFITLVVRDNGSGIDPKLLPHAMEPHVTDGSGGGLGLAICKDIVESHGGTITLQSAPAGTTVSFTLPTEKGGEADA